MEWNTDLIEMKEIKHVMSQAAQDLDDGETRHESREAEAREHEEVQWTKHASRSDSQAQQHDLTSRGGVLEERVYARCPQHMSTITNEAKKTEYFVSVEHQTWKLVQPHDDHIGVHIDADVDVTTLFQMPSLR